VSFVDFEGTAATALVVTQRAHKNSLRLAQIDVSTVEVCECFVTFVGEKECE
jgi:hypothetical protein